MTKAKIERKVAVIFAADVVDYSKHMEADENSTVQRLRECEKILTDLFTQFNGRLFNTGGDSFFAEFRSAVSAVECAMAFQSQISELNKSSNTAVELQFRIGINSGDVILENDNLLGDGVNIASRLESLAQPGGVTISRSVYDFVKGKTTVEFNDLGVQKIKKNSFHAFDALLDPSHKRRLYTKGGPYKKFIMGVLAVAVVLSLATYAWLTLNHQTSSQMTVDVQDKPSLVIMPFKNLTGDDGNEYVSLGLGVALLTTLSKNERLTIPSEDTGKFFQKNEIVDQEIFEKHGFRYILRGSVQGTTDNLRINVAMSDLEKQETIWSEVFDFKEHKDLFEVQDLLAAAVLKELELSFTVGGAGVGLSKDPEVYKRQILGWSAFQYANSENHMKAERLFNEALALEPDNLHLLSASGWVLYQKVQLKLSTSPKEDLKNALSIAQSVLSQEEIFSALALAHFIARGQKNFTSACELVPKMVGRALNAAEFATMGRAQWTCGDVNGAVASFQRVREIGPHFSSWYKLPFSFSLTESGDLQKARDYMIQELPNLNKPRQERLHMLLAYSHIKLGEIDAAKKMYALWQGEKKDKTAERVIWYFRNNRSDSFADEIIAALEPLNLPLK